MNSPISLNPQITVGNILTIFSVVVSITGLLFSWHKSRVLRTREYADRIRMAASEITTKMQRWREILLAYFYDIQPILTKADSSLIHGAPLNEEEIIEVRDSLWESLVEAKAKTLHRILDEQIEVAYTSLYGYDTKVHALYSEAVNRVKGIDVCIYNLLIDKTQDDVLKLLRPKDKKLISAELGNALRSTTEFLCFECEKNLDIIIARFREEVERIIQSSDKSIVNKTIPISPPEKVFKDVKSSMSIDTLLRKQWWATDGDGNRGKAGSNSDLTEGMDLMIRSADFPIKCGLSVLRRISVGTVFKE